MFYVTQGIKTGLPFIFRSQHALNMNEMRFIRSIYASLKQKSTNFTLLDCFVFPELREMHFVTDDFFTLFLA